MFLYRVHARMPLNAQ